MVIEIGGGEQRDVVTGGDEPVGQQRGEELPRAVVPGRGAPGDGREHADAEGRCRDVALADRRNTAGYRCPLRRRAVGSEPHPLGRVASLGLDGRTGIVAIALRRLDASTELTSGARRGRSSYRRSRSRHRPAHVRHAVDVPSHGVRHRHVLGGALLGLVALGGAVDVVRCGEEEDVEDPLVVASTGAGGSVGSPPRPTP